MSRATFLTIICITFLVLTGIRNAVAETSYVTDSFEITLRSGPSSTNKIIKILHSDEPLQVLSEEGSWLSVQLTDGTQGWVLKRFVTQNIPKSLQIQKLKARNEQLESLSGGAAGKLDTLSNENSSLQSTLETAREQYQKLQERYNALKADADHVLTLKKEYTATENKLKQTTDSLKRLSLENQRLRMSTNLGWFLSGAGVVGISWLIGYLMGRSRRRKQSSRLF